MSWSAIVVTLLCRDAPTLGKQPVADRQRSVTLVLAKDRHLPGDPVVLELQYRNLRQTVRLVAQDWLDSDEPPFDIFTSSNESGYSLFRFGLSRRQLLDVPRWEFKPGDVWKHELRVLYSRMKGGTLAFPKPGTYFLKTGDQPPDALTWHAESNVLKIHIEEPAGIDAKVWGQMQDRRVYSLLQSGSFAPKPQPDLDPPWADRDTVLLIARLLKEHPETRYRAAFGWSLRRVYFRQGLELTADERQAVREALGIIDVHTHADPRLDIMVRGVRDREWLLGDLLATLSEQTRTPLDAPVEMKRQKVRLSIGDGNLRRAMATISIHFRTPWWPLGRGFVLGVDRPAN